MTPVTLVQVAEQLQRSREARNDVFGADAAGFGDPAWDMLVDLFLADARGERPTVADLVKRDHVEASTGYTYLRWLRSRGLVAIAGEDVELEERGRGLMLAYLEQNQEIIW